MIVSFKVECLAPFFARDVLQRYATCNSSETLRRAQDIYGQYVGKEMEGECPEPCNSIQVFFLLVTLCQMVLFCRQPSRRKFKKTHRTSRSSRSFWRIRFGSERRSKWREMKHLSATLHMFRPSYSFFTMVAEIGGYLGLLLGVSIVQTVKKFVIK